MKTTGEGSFPSTGLAISGLFAALLCVGAYIAFPLAFSPVPIALGNFFAVLGGLLLGPWWGAASPIIYIAIGALGFPVFSGGRGGIAHLIGPTGGYLAGYVLGAFLAGWVGKRRSVLATAAGAFLGFSAILALGFLGLKLTSGSDWPKAMALGILPFIPGDAIKAVLAAFLALRLGPFVDSLRSRSSGA